MTAHGNHLGDDLLICPRDTKDLCELLQILRAGFSDAENGVAEPRHAKAGKLLIEELYTKLRS